LGENRLIIYPSDTDKRGVNYKRQEKLFKESFLKAKIMKFRPRRRVVVVQLHVRINHSPLPSIAILNRPIPKFPLLPWFLQQFNAKYL